MTVPKPKPKELLRKIFNMLTDEEIDIFVDFLDETQTLGDEAFSLTRELLVEMRPSLAQKLFAL
jgi:hypothetical protein